MDENKEDFKISQLTKELVTARLRSLEDPCAATADLVKRTLSVALKGLEPGAIAESRIIEDACQGGMTGLLLAENPLPKGAVSILEAVVDLAAQLNLDQPEMMKSALRGIADMRRFVQPNQLHEIEVAIETRYTGTGLVFRELCEQPTGQEAPQRQPG
jgi:hypothetical protein